MKFLSIVFLVFFSLAVTNSYSIITVRIHPGIAFPGGDWSNSRCGSYMSHQIKDLGGGNNTCNVRCENSQDMCFSANQDGTDVVVTIYNLVSEGAGGSGSGVFYHYEIALDSTGSLIINNYLETYGN